MTVITQESEIKDYLSEYIYTDRKLKSLEEQMTSIRESKQSARAQILNGLPSSNRHRDLSDYICKLEEVEKDIEYARNQWMSKKIDIEKRVIHMKDGIESDIIRKRYLEGKKWEDICIDIGYSWNETHKKHRRALKNFKRV